VGILKKRCAYGASTRSTNRSIESEPILLTEWDVSDVDLVDGRTGWTCEIRCEDVGVSGKWCVCEAGSIHERVTGQYRRHGKGVGANVGEKLEVLLAGQVNVVDDGVLERVGMSGDWQGEA